MIDPELHKQIEALRCTVGQTGSRVICTPAPAHSDWDYLVFAPDAVAVSKLVGLIGAAGFKWEGSKHYQNATADGFASWRKDGVNLIVTSSKDFADKHRVATALCKRLNLTDKGDRVAVFQAVLYSREWAK